MWGKLVDMYVGKFTDAGNVYQLTFIEEGGKEWNFEKELARTILNSESDNVRVYSQRYTISSDFSLYANGLKINASSGIYAAGANGVSLIGVGQKILSLLTGSGISNVDLSGSRSSTYVINGRGAGHNVGMSQYGAKGMAVQGYKC